MPVEAETDRCRYPPVPAVRAQSRKRLFLDRVQNKSRARRNNRQPRLHGIECLSSRLIRASLVINLQDISAGMACSRPTIHAMG